MDFWQLKVFCKVIELKSFSKAGQAVRLSQPTVSSHIKDLENHFNTRLIDRSVREALPTKAGELLYKYALQFIQLSHETEAAMSEFLGKIKGHLTIGGSTIPGGYLLPRLVGAFYQAFPEVNISLMVADTDEIIEKTATGRIELSVVGARSDDKRLHQTPLIDDEMRLVVPADHPWAHRTSVTIKELAQAPFIVRERGSGTLRSLQQCLQPSDFELSRFAIVAEMGSTEAVRQAIKNKVGVSILSFIAVADDVENGHLKTLTVKNLDLKRSFYLTTHKHRTTSPLCQAFSKFLFDYALDTRGFETTSNKVQS